MKPPILLLAFSVFAFSSCTTAYKSGQTPDDLYYSSAKPQDENVRDDQKEEENYSYNDEYYDDRYLRMKVRNRARWYDLDDWYYYDRYSFRYNYYFGSYNNPFNAWNYYYNPYCCCQYNYGIGNTKIPAAKPVLSRHFSLGGYTNTVYSNTNNTRTYKVPATTGGKPDYNNSNGLSNKIKTIFSNSNSGNGSSRTYTPSSSGSGNSGGSSGGGSGKSGSSGSVSRPVRN